MRSCRATPTPPNARSSPTSPRLRTISPALRTRPGSCAVRRGEKADPVIPGRCVSIEPQMRNCASGKFELPRGCNCTPEVWSFGPSRNDDLNDFLRHCEERSDEAIQTFFVARLDCFAALAMTAVGASMGQM